MTGDLVTHPSCGG